MSEHKTLQEKLASGKEKAALREFEVTITETLQMKVTVTAKDQSEAEQMVNDAWDNSDYILDAEHFIGASFDALPVTREHSRSAER